jgi:hypothetical protein
MHYNDDELILYYYGEHRRRVRVEEHLSQCASCRARYEDITSSLALVSDPAVPDRDDLYGLEVWQRIRHRLPEQDVSWWTAWTQPPRLALLAAAAILVIAAFVAGRTWPRPVAPVQQTIVVPESRLDAGERVRLAAVGDHLEQSEGVLLDLLNAAATAGEPADISAQQQWAADLITTNRLFRDASAEAGDDTVAALLDELERNLLELVHGPATLTQEELDRIRLRLDAAALLFRVRVLSEELREREVAPITPRNTI